MSFEDDLDYCLRKNDYSLEDLDYENQLHSLIADLVYSEGSPKNARALSSYIAKHAPRLLADDLEKLRDRRTPVSIAYSEEREVDNRRRASDMRAAQC